MATEIVEYSKTEAALSDLAHRYKDVIFDVKSKDGMMSAIKGRAEIRTYRVNLEKLRIEIKAPALKKCQLIDSEAKRITVELVALEDPIDAQIKKEEMRKEDERTAVARAEAERIAAEERAKKEAEEKRMAEERAEIARRQAELDRAEQERIKAEAEAEAKRKMQEAQRAAREAIEKQEREARLIREEADRKAREEREAEERKARELRDAEDARLKAERDRLDQEQRAIDEEKRKNAEANYAREREIEKKKLAILDARAILKLFVKHYGKVPEFESVVKCIHAYFKEYNDGSGAHISKSD